MTLALSECFRKYRCDKHHKHYYSAIYSRLLPASNHPIKLLEVGILNGASLSAFHDYYPNGEIYGMDTFQRVPIKDIPALKSPRVDFIEHDSREPQVADAIKELWGDDIQFDVIIDDGNHYAHSQFATLRNLWQFVKPGGLYIVEDVWPLFVPGSLDYRPGMNKAQMGQVKWARNHTSQTDVDNLNEMWDYAQTLGTTEWIDNRSTSYEGDSTLIVIENDNDT